MTQQGVVTYTFTAIIVLLLIVYAVLIASLAGADDGDDAALNTQQGGSKGDADDTDQGTGQAAPDGTDAKPAKTSKNPYDGDGGSETVDEYQRRSWAMTILWGFLIIILIGPLMAMERYLELRAEYHD